MFHINLRSLLCYLNKAFNHYIAQKRYSKVLHQIHSNLSEVVFPKQSMRSAEHLKEGNIICESGYDYWIVMENPAFIFGKKIVISYKFELGIEIVCLCTITNSLCISSLLYGPISQNTI